ncbi:MAG: glycosyltransferase family 4 protein [Microthrixaceae bacterium]
MSRVRLIHLTTTDISLELLIGPQLSAFVDAGYEVIALSAPGPFVEQVEARGVRHIPLEHATRSMALREDARALAELRARFRELRPTIVHTHNPKPGVYGRLAARAARVPIVVNTVHGLYATPDDSWKKRAVVYSLERLAATCSDAELVQNPEDVATLRDTLRIPQSRISLLGNGVDLGRFGRDADRAARRARLRAEFGLRDDQLVVGAVGRLVAEKGYPELFEAWRTVVAEHPDAVLVVVGPDDDAKSDALPRALIEQATADGVRFLGMRSDVEDLYTAFDLYVLASHREGFPRSAMEAAASGLPIIATQIRGCRQVVDDGVTGLLVPVRDARGLATAIHTLLEDTERREAMAVAAADRAVREFDQQRVIDIILETYRQLLRARGLAEPVPVA